MVTCKGINIDFIVAVLAAFYGAPEGYRRWFHQPEFDVYLRNGPREFHGREYRALTIADVTVKEECRARGVFSDLLLDAQAAALILRYDAVFVESLRIQLMAPLMKRGFLTRHAGGMVVDMLKPLRD